MSISVELIKKCATKVEGHADDIDDLAVFTNSREQVVNGLFVPIEGERFDGHQFLEQAIQSGAVAAIWTEGKALPENLPNDFPIFYTDDSLKGLQQLAAEYLKEQSPKVIAVTGSNGKTTTKDIVEHVTATAFETYKTQGNYNNHIGLPLTILTMPETCEVLILEMGMNHFGEISLLSKIASPDIAIITNIGESHIEFLGSREGIAKAKLEIVDGLKPGGTLIIDGDEPLLTGFRSEQHTIMLCGYNGRDHIQITQVTADINGYKFQINENEGSFYIPLLGRHNVKNAALAIAAAKQLGIHCSDIQKGFDHLSVTGMRLETIHGRNGALIINDSYNASPTSMKAAIQTVRSLPGFQKRVIVLGNMYELGADEEKLHKQVAEDISPPVTHVITIGEKAKWIAEELASNEDGITIAAFSDKTLAIPHLEKLLAPGTVLLFKASRIAALETLVAELKA
ncbi:UDP-N-acetylmuramoyl-tripeptide--D-alanyl-D-alanine ligase [Scopulibacillus darangshiensis]|uniref:UDP-N-acetylmuramoyl-tripeptide--D-alanyl-D-alanine ligase n=1 Tax=Scopulibacillus darangshiensis TaxID=442528 RepID=A0A4R2P4K4_9BACL|nr:UDP-N-acetylmuramoyl-tripeptide--D-alanyl-D-alanine ligase [Scopulibacillus darangshiensis]TCP29088.1 UDP-N-acetylmuramoyl-tripeptide--D-alanyl-D-alanine ligase [Scopulibacillus darangshiensis]